MMENVHVKIFVLKWLKKNGELIMFTFANLESQKVGVVQELVNANVVPVKTVNVWGIVKGVNIGAQMMENHVVGAWMTALQSARREREVETIATG